MARVTRGDTVSSSTAGCGTVGGDNVGCGTGTAPSAATLSVVTTPEGTTPAAIRPTAKSLGAARTAATLSAATLSEKASSAVALAGSPSLPAQPPVVAAPSAPVVRDAPPLTTRSPSSALRGGGRRGRAERPPSYPHPSGHAQERAPTAEAAVVAAAAPMGARRRQQRAWRRLGDAPVAAIPRRRAPTRSRGRMRQRLASHLSSAAERCMYSTCVAARVGLTDKCAWVLPMHVCICSTHDSTRSSVMQGSHEMNDRIYRKGDPADPRASGIGEGRGGFRTGHTGRKLHLQPKR